MKKYNWGEARYIGVLLFGIVFAVGSIIGIIASFSPDYNEGAAFLIGGIGGILTATILIGTCLVNLYKAFCNHHLWKYRRRLRKVKKRVTLHEEKSRLLEELGSG